MRAAQKIRVMCVDDHRVMLDGLALLIGRQPDMEMVASATDGEAAIAKYVGAQPDVTLMDLQLPGTNGLEAIRRIRSGDQKARIVVLTMYHGDEDIYRALEAGAATYLLKDALSDELVDTIRRVHHGHAALPPEVEAQLETRRQQPALTPREVEVVRLITEGLRNKEIAVMLGISEQTAKVHVKNILAKLRVNDRAAVISVAARRGIVHL